MTLYVSTDGLTLFRTARSGGARDARGPQDMNMIAPRERRTLSKTCVNEHLIVRVISARTMSVKERKRHEQET